MKYNNPEKILQHGDLKVGDYVHHRHWDYGTGKAEPVVTKRPMRIVELRGEEIVCGGGKCFLPCELIKSSWKPS